MDINPTVWWILGLLFVYIFGLIEGRGQGYKRRKKEEAQEVKEKPSAPVKSTHISADSSAILRIANEQGKLILDLDGSRVNHFSLTSDQRKRLIDILNIIQPWLDGKPAAPPPPPTSMPASIPSASTPPQQVAPISPPVSQIPKPAIEGDRPATAPNSIVGQIDSILQAQIVGTPLAEQGIFLAESPEGGVLVYIGLDKYAGIDDVPDVKIRSAIRTAIAQWEKKYTPGL